MLQTIKRWFTRGSLPGEWAAVEDWADARGHQFRRSREGNGFVIDGGDLPLRWRLEWGPSQRAYIAGHELRLRGELGPVELQLLLLSRSLVESMEKEVFEQYTEDLQTRVDTATPEEMRWLVLFQKLPGQDLKSLRDSFAAVGPTPRWLLQWLDGPLTLQLQQARSGWLAPEDPFVLIAHRGRLTLRTQCAEPDLQRLTAALSLFQVALREALRIAELWTDQSMASTQPSLWSNSAPGYLDTPAKGPAAEETGPATKP
jgi:hypothetical protein